MSDASHAYHRQLEAHIQTLLPSAHLKRLPLKVENAAGQGLTLWLIDPDGMDAPLSEEETRAIFANPPYWSFCWGSGLALAERLLNGAHSVKGKTVLDFGCGSAVVAIAAALAGAAEVIACDIDPLALKASALNASENGVELAYLDDFFNFTGKVDILFAADVLYDPDNRPLVQRFREVADEVVVADSRVKNFAEQGFVLCGEVRAVTEPDLGELESVKQIRFYQSQGS
ncbi:MAG: 50S ribosomal protein L11 methyltransferase [Gammaproteobacteria bacterium]|nr:50S ribosomal protein L11 methyltransferase [Gammaproteobacteria bacterium]MBQ0838971.1 50S ribosomal protein L11 methyltransferase [Gammaproteobacteria bacterium]